MALIAQILIGFAIGIVSGVVGCLGQRYYDYLFIGCIAVVTFLVGFHALISGGAILHTDFDLTVVVVTALSMLPGHVLGEMVYSKTVGQPAPDAVALTQAIKR